MLLDVSTRKGFDIASALRGPDSTSVEALGLKYLTTSVVRYFAGCAGIAWNHEPNYPDNYMPGNSSGYVNTPEQARMYFQTRTDGQIDAIREAAKKEFHFMLHFSAAIYAINTPEANDWLNWVQKNITVFTEEVS